MNWTADIMTDPARNHQLHVELRQEENFRARVYQDEAGKLQLWVYEGTGVSIPIDWLLSVIHQFSKELQGSNNLTNS